MMLINNIIYTYDCTHVNSLLTFCLDNISNISFITFSVIITIALPTVFLSGGIRKNIINSGKWIGAGVGFGAGEYGIEKALDSVLGSNPGNNNTGGESNTGNTGAGSNTGNSSGEGSNTGNSSGGSSSS